MLNDDSHWKMANKPASLCDTRSSLNSAEFLDRNQRHGAIHRDPVPAACKQFGLAFAIRGRCLASLCRLATSTLCGRPLILPTARSQDALGCSCAPNVGHEFVATSQRARPSAPIGSSCLCAINQLAIRSSTVVARSLLLDASSRDSRKAHHQEGRAGGRRQGCVPPSEKLWSSLAISIVSGYMATCKKSFNS